jgi:hypothetical protein
LEQQQERFFGTDASNATVRRCKKGDCGWIIVRV